MITGLLFTLAYKPPVIDTDKIDEGHAFPPSSINSRSDAQKVKAPFNVVRLTQVVSVILTVIGVSLLSMGAATWSFDPAQGLNIQTAILSFTLPVGVFS